MKLDTRPIVSTIRWPAIAGGVAAVGWFAIDQAVKWWIVDRLIDPPRVIPLASYFNLVLGWKRGVSFGMLTDIGLPPWVLAALAVIVAVALLIWLARASRPLVAIALGFVIGGALGNAFDRMRHGAVADFLDFHVAGWHWPAFNFADVGIVCGLLALLLESFWSSNRRLNSEGERRVDIEQADANKTRS